MTTRLNAPTIEPVRLAEGLAGFFALLGQLELAGEDGFGGGVLVARGQDGHEVIAGPLKELDEGGLVARLDGAEDQAGRLDRHRGVVRRRGLDVDTDGLARGLQAWLSGAELNLGGHR